MNRIKELREARGMTASELARTIGVAKTSVREWEKENVIPSVYAAYKTAKALGVTIEYMMGYMEVKADGNEKGN